MTQFLSTTAPDIVSAASSRRVKDAPTRAAHWWMAGSFVVAYLTGEGESWRLWHVIAGYSMVLALAFRVVWGMAGPRTVALSLWGRRLGASLRWLRQQAKPQGMQAWRHQPRTQLQQAMAQGTSLSILLLLVALPVLGLTGYATYQEWTGDWMAELHEWLGNVAIAAVALHLSVLLAGSMLRGQNQAQAMLSGRQAGSGPDLVPRNRLWLALLFSAAMLAFATWYWQDARATLATQADAPSAQRTALSDRQDHDD